MQRDTLTTAEAARLLGITPAAVRQALRRGALTGDRRGRDWLIPRAEVARYARARQPSGPRPRQEGAR